MRTADAAQEFLGCRRFAVTGVSREPANHGSNVVYTRLRERGYDVVAINPNAETVEGDRCYPTLADVPGEIDLLNVFRRSEDIPKHTDEILSKKPKAVWFQLGIRNDEVAEKLADAGIKVVQDLCLMVEHRALVR